MQTFGLGQRCISALFDSSCLQPAWLSCWRLAGGIWSLTSSRRTARLPQRTSSSSASMLHCQQARSKLITSEDAQHNTLMLAGSSITTMSCFTTCSLTSSCKQETLPGQEGVGILCMGEYVNLGCCVDCNGNARHQDYSQQLFRQSSEKTAICPWPMSFRLMHGDQARFFADEVREHLKHRTKGMVAMASASGSPYAAHNSFAYLPCMPYACVHGLQAEASACTVACRSTPAPASMFCSSTKKS